MAWQSDTGNGINVLNVRMYDRTLDTLTSRLISEITEQARKHSRCISATGAHGLVRTRKDREFARILNEFYVNLPDGMPTVWIGRLKGASQMQRCYGPAFFEAIMRQTAGKSIKHYLCGGKEGVADNLREVCGAKFSNENVVGVYCPPFREMTESEMQLLADQISISGAQIVWIGLSTPKQEYFAARLATFIQVHFIITVGAAFDFHTSRIRQAPPWMQKTGLEWFFRLCSEPRRLWRRYFEVVPLFIWYNVFELLCWVLSRIFNRRIGHAS